MARLSLTPFDPNDELARFVGERTDAGALASFVGLVRSEAHGETALQTLTLEHYDGFTQNALADIEDSARARFDVLDVLVIHRAGSMVPGEPIVLAAALSLHRKEALAAVDYLMDRLKTDAPFWKRESGPSGDRWIEPTDADRDVRKAWETRK
jgi:molybdopterin synthase catalytic subunit